MENNNSKSTCFSFLAGSWMKKLAFLGGFIFLHIFTFIFLFYFQYWVICLFCNKQKMVWFKWQSIIELEVLLITMSYILSFRITIPSNGLPTAQNIENKNTVNIILKQTFRFLAPGQPLVIIEHIACILKYWFQKIRNM